MIDIEFTLAFVGAALSIGIVYCIVKLAYLLSNLAFDACVAQRNVQHLTDRVEHLNNRLYAIEKRRKK